MGISSLERHTATAASFESLSTAIGAGQVVALESQLATFQSALRSFASKHASSIRSDPAFRTAFSSMCAELGVDPLGGGRKGIWDHVGVGQWTYELAVQVVDVCLRSRDLNGGLMDMDEVLRGVRALREGPAKPRSLAIGAQEVGSTDLRNAVTESDVARALTALSPFGCGYSVVEVGRRKLVRSVASEFDTGSLAIASSVDDRGFTTHQLIAASTGWTMARTRDAVEAALLRDGVVWLDGQAGVEDRLYASLFQPSRPDCFSCRPRRSPPCLALSEHALSAIKLAYHKSPTSRDLARSGGKSSPSWRLPTTS